METERAIAPRPRPRTAAAFAGQIPSITDNGGRNGENPSQCQRGQAEIETASAWAGDSVEEARGGAGYRDS